MQHCFISHLQHLVCGLSAAAIAATALTQPSTAYAQNSLALEEITVTARKREESLLDAPVAVTAVTGQEIEGLGITGMEQLSAKVPGLQIGRAAQTSNISIRGVGSGINKGFEQTVGMYIDGIYQPRSRQFTQSLVDLQQVEVLRGPQSVLFGKNTVAGAIKVETATPTVGQEFNGGLTVAYEPEYGTQVITGLISGSLSDTVAARLVARDYSSDGYVRSGVYDRDEQQRDDQLVRLTLAFEPTDTLSIVAKLSHVNMESLGKEATINSVSDEITAPATLAVLSPLREPDFTPSINGNEYLHFIGNSDWDDGDQEDTEATSATVKIDWELGDYTVTSLTGFSQFEFVQRHDVDFLPINFISNRDEEDFDMFSQELRVSTNFDGRFNLFGGIYFEKQELDLGAWTHFDGTFGLGQAILPGPQEVGMPTEFAQESESIALFGEASFDLSDRLTLDIGLRYSEDEKDVHKRVSVGIGQLDQIQILVTPEDTVGSADLNAYLAAAAAAGGADGAGAAATFAALLNRYATDINSSRSEDHFDPSVRLRYTYSDDGMAYFSYSEGYKSGGFNFSPDTANSDGSARPGHEFEDESVRAFELGFKQSLMDGRARLSATLYQSELENLQVTSWSGTSFVVGNAAELTVSGLELEGQMVLNEYFEIGGSLAYLDHEFDSFPGAGCSTVELQTGSCPNSAGAGTKDLAGQRGAFAPEYSGSLYLDFNHRVGNVDWYGHVDLNYKDEMFLEGDLDPNAYQGSYTKLNARVGFSLDDGRWDFMLYGRNLTDKVTYTASIDAPLSPGVYVGWIEEPRIYGLQARYNFGN